MFLLLVNKIGSSSDKQWNSVHFVTLAFLLDLFHLTPKWWASARANRVILQDSASHLFRWWLPISAGRSANVTVAPRHSLEGWLESFSCLPHFLKTHQASFWFPVQEPDTGILDRFPKIAWCVLNIRQFCIPKRVRLQFWNLNPLA